MFRGKSFFTGDPVIALSKGFARLVAEFMSKSVHCQFYNIRDHIVPKSLKRSHSATTQVCKSNVKVVDLKAFSSREATKLSRLRDGVLSSSKALNGCGLVRA